jgi:CheY-like chemotaxis protein
MTNPRLLLVEDHPAGADALRRLLSRAGMDVVCATTVREARTMLHPAPDWIVLDLMLPDGCGLEVLEEVRAAGLPSRVAVVTATVEPTLIDAVRELRPDVLLNKPIRLEPLLKALELAE